MVMGQISDRELHEECGVFGVFGVKDAASLTYYGLHALQHRGQESCGIAVSDTEGPKGKVDYYKDMGLVNEVFDEERLNRLHGNIGVGHVRYSTAGASNRENAQPLIIHYIKGTLAVAHNGNLTNSAELRSEFELSGAIFHSTSDTEVIAYAITRERLSSDSIEQAVEQTMDRLKGAYSLVVMSPRKLIAARDPQGFRPLCIGKLGENDIIASESCAITAAGGEFVRDVEPGEIVVFDENGCRSIRTHCGCPTGLCVFEYVYIARPDSVVDGASVHRARRRAGAFLALEHPVQADVVIGVPDSGLDAALGYSQQSGIPYGIGFLKNKYIGRTFIQPNQKLRENTVRIKLNPIADTVRGKLILCPEKTSAHYLLSTWLHILGLKDEDVKIQNVLPGPAVDMFSKGFGDAVSIWAPATYTAAQKGYQIAASSPDCGIRQPILLLADREFADKNPEQVRAFLRVYLRVVDAMHSEGFDAFVQEYIRFNKTWNEKLMTREEAVEDLRAHPVFSLGEQITLFHPESGNLRNWLRGITAFYGRIGELSQEDVANLNAFGFLNDSFLKGLQQ